MPCKPKCKYLKYVKFDRFGTEKYCRKDGVPSQFVLEEEDKSLKSETLFLVCQRMERWADKWGDEGGEESVSWRQWGRCEERPLWEGIHEVNPAKNKPKPNYGLFKEFEQTQR